MSSRVTDDVSGTLLRSVLVTDLVGHTEMMSRLGDERGRDVREHERIARDCSLPASMGFAVFQAQVPMDGTTQRPPTEYSERSLAYFGYLLSSHVLGVIFESPYYPGMPLGRGLAGL